MRSRRCGACSMVVAATLAMPQSANAQGTDVGLTGAALLSVQSTDQTWQSPYLDGHIGGAAPGFGAGVSVIGEGGFTAIAELTSARFERVQRGRVIPGNCIPIPLSFECSATTRLNDSLLSGLIGYARSAGRTRTLFLGGLSTLLDSATTNGVSIHDNVDVGGRIGFTGGMDVLIAVAPRIAIGVGARYTFIARSEPEIAIGAGSMIVRVLGGVRVRLH